MTNGCSGSSIYRFIKYVEGTGSDIEQVFEEADRNDNGLTKSELKKFLDSLDPEWGLSKNDASDIFKTFNTNLSGKTQKINGDDDVEGKYEKLMKNFTEIKNEVEKELKKYGNMGISADDIMNALAGKFDKNLNINNLQNILPKLVAQAVAVVIAENALEAVDAGSVPPGYDATKDDDLIGLLNSYINSLQGRTDDIEGSIEAIIEAYIEGTELEDDDLAPFAWNPKNGLNELQKQEILNGVKSKVTLDKIGLDNTTEYQKLLDQAILDYIDEKYSEWSYDDIMSDIEDLDSNIFVSSKSGKAFLILTLYADFDKSNDSVYNKWYYKGIAGAFGDDFAELLAEGDKNIPAYQNILKQVAEMVKKGEVEPDKAVDKIIQLIAQNYAAIGRALGLDSTDLPVDKAYGLFENAYSNGNGELAHVRATAIRFLDAVSAYDNVELQTVIKNNFGEDYKTKINEITVLSTISNGINDVYEKYNKLVTDEEIIDIGSLDIDDNSDGCYSGITICAGISTDDIDASIKVMNGKKELTNSPAHKITYDANGGSFLTDVSITEDGKLSFKAGNNDGTDTITVSVLVNGQVVGTKTITVTIKKEPDLRKAFTYYDGNKDIPTTIQDLLDKANNGKKAGSCIVFDQGAPREAAQTKTKSIISSLATAFLGTGYPESAVDKAKKTMDNYYFRLFQNIAMSDSEKLKLYNDNYTYHNYITDKDEYVGSVNLSETSQKKNVDGLDDFSGSPSSGVFVGKLNKGWGKTDTFFVYIDVAVLTKKFKEFLDQAIGA